MNYAKTGVLSDFDNLEEANAFSRFSCENLMTGGGDSVRERITVDLIHGHHISEKHGWDGKRGNLFLEVKNETIGENKPVSGRGIFNNLTWKSFQKYKNENGLYISAGYSREGVLLYAVAFDIKHILPVLEESLMKVFPDGEDRIRENTTVSISAIHFPDKLEVIYIPDCFQYKKYSDRLTNLIFSNKKTKLGKTRLSTKPRKRD